MMNLAWISLFVGLSSVVVAVLDHYIVRIRDYEWRRFMMFGGLALMGCGAITMLWTVTR